MSVKVVTDSTCDLPKEVVEKLGVTVVPCYINMDNVSYEDGVNITRKEFYERLPHCKTFPTTSAPGIDTFVQTYRRLLTEEGSEVISIHIANALSNVGNIARLAAQSDEKLKVSVVDSGQITLGVGLIIEAAAIAAKAGETLKDILSLVQQKIRKVYSYASLDTLEFLRRGGRMSHVQYHITSLLDIKPILKMHAGNSGMELARTRKRSWEKMMGMVKALGELSRLDIVHTNAPDAAKFLYQAASHLFPGNATPIFAEVSPVIGAHVGPGAVGFVCEVK